jgi:hypothetical protein
MGKEYCVDCPHGNLIITGLLHKSCQQCRDSIDEFDLNRNVFFDKTGTKDEQLSSKGYGVIKEGYDITRKRW